MWGHFKELPSVFLAPFGLGLGVEIPSSATITVEGCGGSTTRIHRSGKESMKRGVFHNGAKGCVADLRRSACVVIERTSIELLRPDDFVVGNPRFPCVPPKPDALNRKIETPYVHCSPCSQTLNLCHLKHKR